MTTKIASSNIAASTLAVLGGPKITTIAYPGTETATDTQGGETITLTGTGFNAGASVIVNGQTAGVVTVVSSTQVTFTAPAQSAGTYAIYLVNTDGGTAIAVPGLSYSGTPAWTTSAGSLGNFYETGTIAQSLVATGDAPIVYSVVSGTLPPGSTLSSSGQLSGTGQTVASATTYNFTVQAKDAQNQPTNRAFSVTINPDVVTWSSPASGSTNLLSVNSAGTLNLSASSAAGNSITYTADTLPAGMAISGSTVTGTPTTSGTTSSTITATAATSGKTAQITFSWSVTVAIDQYFKYNTLFLNAETPAAPFTADASTNNLAVALAGDTCASNFGPYQGGYYSTKFNGSTSIGSFTGPAIGTGDYTIEFWVYHNTLASDQDWYETYSGSNVNIFLEWDSTSQRVRHRLTNDAGTSNFDFNSTAALTANTWNHLAFVLSGTTAYTFINGNYTTQGATATATGTRSGTFTNNLIGALYSGSRYFNGYMSNFRLVKGTALYTSNFTPSTTPLTAISGTALLLCQSNRIIDTSSNNYSLGTIGAGITVNSFVPFTPDATYNTLGSAYFDGDGDYLTIPASSAFTLGTNNHTIECWYYAAGTQLQNAVLWAYTSGSTNQATNSYYLNVGFGGPAIVLGNGGGWGISITFAQPSINVWHHIAAVRNGNVFTLYIDGVSVGTGTYAANIASQSSYPFEIGGQVTGSGNLGTTAFKGYISNFRVTNGTAVYTANFTPPTQPLTALTNTQLLTLQTNQNIQNNSIIDNSTNNFPITRYGNTTQGSLAPFGSSWSNYFNGSTDYLTATSTGFSSTGDLTLEAWAYITSGSTYQGIASLRNSTGGAGLGINIINTGYLEFTLTGGTTYAGTLCPLNQWFHVALVRSGSATNNCSCYLNGVRLAQFTATGEANQSGNVLIVGRYYANGTNQYSTSGYISNVRYVVGTALYSGATYTVPTAALTPVTNTALLTCQSPAFQDNSANAFTLTVTGTPSVQCFSPFSNYIQTPQSYSTKFNGSTDYSLLPVSTNLALGTGDFTVEAWVYLNSVTGTQGVYSSIDNSNDTWQGVILAFSGTSFIATSYISGADTITHQTAVSAGQWYHIAIVRSGSSTKSYLNGVQSTGTTSGNFNLTQSGSTVGAYYAGSSYLNGYISNLRVVKGTAVYTSNFTPPTSPLTAITNTQLLACQDATIKDNSTNQFTLTTSGAPTPKKFNTFGYTTSAIQSYDPSIYGGSMYFDGSGDYLTASAPNLIGSWTIEFWMYGTPAGASTTMVSFNNGSYTGINIWKNASNQLVIDDGANAQTAFTTVIPPNAWTHVAVVRNGTTTTAYLNGNIAGTNTFTPSTTSAVYVGRYNGGNPAYYVGYLSSLRVVNGTALYTSNFVPPAAPVISIPNTSLLFSGTAAGIYDYSMMNNLETVGNTQLAPQQPYAGSYYSNYFSGTGQYLTATGSSAFTLGTGDFTIECWFNTAVGTNNAMFQLSNTAGGFNTTYTNTIAIGLLAGKLNLYGVAGTGLTSTGASYATSTWTHVALVRSSGVTKLYINGVLDTTIGTAGAITDTVSYTMQYIVVGGYYSTSYLWNGNVSNLRIVKGTAVYTSSFTPSTAPLTAISGTSLLTCQSNKFIDNSTNNFTLTTAGTPTVQVFNPFANSSGQSIYFDGNGDGLIFRSSPSVAMGAGDFTVEFWFYSTASQANYTKYFCSGTSVGSLIIDQQTTANTITVNNNSTVYLTSGAISNGVWTHVAIVRSGTTLSIYLNGTSSASVTNSTNFIASDTQSSIGSYPDGTKSVNGYIDDFRVTKGYARYTGNFTPPTATLLTK